MVDRTRKEFSDEDITRIAETYHTWRGEPDADAYEDEPGFCNVVTLEETRTHNHVLTPGQYVRAEAAEEDDTLFAERFAALQQELETRFSEAEVLAATIRERLAGVSI